MTIPLSTFTLEHMARAKAAVDELREIRPLVPYLIANGVLVMRDVDAVTLVSEIVEHRDSGEIRQLLERFESTARLAGVADTDGHHLTDLCHRFASLHSRAGYLLGLLVGQSLSPDAFGGGVR